MQKACRKSFDGRCSRLDMFDLKVESDYSGSDSGFGFGSGSGCGSGSE